MFMRPMNSLSNNSKVFVFLRHIVTANDVPAQLERKAPSSVLKKGVMAPLPAEIENQILRFADNFGLESERIRILNKPVYSRR